MELLYSKNIKIVMVLGPHGIGKSTILNNLDQTFDFGKSMREGATVDETWDLLEKYLLSLNSGYVFLDILSTYKDYIRFIELFDTLLDSTFILYSIMHITTENNPYSVSLRRMMDRKGRDSDLDPMKRIEHYRKHNQSIVRALQSKIRFEFSVSNNDLDRSIGDFDWKSEIEMELRNLHGMHNGNRSDITTDYHDVINEIVDSLPGEQMKSGYIISSDTDLEMINNISDQMMWTIKLSNTARCMLVTYKNVCFLYLGKHKPVSIIGYNILPNNSIFDAENYNGNRYFVFDIMRFNGRKTWHLCLAKRQEMLNAIFYKHYHNLVIQKPWISFKDNTRSPFALFTEHRIEITSVLIAAKSQSYEFGTNPMMWESVFNCEVNIRPELSFNKETSEIEIKQYDLEHFDFNFKETSYVNLFCEQKCTNSIDDTWDQTNSYEFGTKFDNGNIYYIPISFQPTISVKSYPNLDMRYEKNKLIYDSKRSLKHRLDYFNDYASNLCYYINPNSAISSSQDILSYITGSLGDILKETVTEEITETHDLTPVYKHYETIINEKTVLPNVECHKLEGGLRLFSKHNKLRSFVLDEDNNVVARTFPKWKINSPEIKDSETVKCALKVDGTHIMVFVHKGKRYVVSKRRDNSEQAIWTKSWLDKNKINGFVEGYVYLIESVYQDNQLTVPVQYDVCYLLGIINRKGNELPTKEVIDIAEIMGIPTPMQLSVNYGVLKLFSTQPKKHLEYGFIEGWIVKRNKVVCKCLTVDFMKHKRIILNINPTNLNFQRKELHYYDYKTALPSRYRHVLTLIETNRLDALPQSWKQNWCKGWGRRHKVIEYDIENIVTSSFGILDMGVWNIIVDFCGNDVNRLAITSKSMMILCNNYSFKLKSEQIIKLKSQVYPNSKYISRFYDDFGYDSS